SGQGRGQFTPAQRRGNNQRQRNLHHHAGGGFAGKNFANRWLSSPKLAIRVSRMLVFATRPLRLPPAHRTVSRFLNACRAPPENRAQLSSSPALVSFLYRPQFSP